MGDAVKGRDPIKTIRFSGPPRDVALLNHSKDQPAGFTWETNLLIEDSSFETKPSSVRMAELVAEYGEENVVTTLPAYDAFGKALTRYKAVHVRKRVKA